MSWFTATGNATAAMAQRQLQLNQQLATVQQQQVYAQAMQQAHQQAYQNPFGQGLSAGGGGAAQAYGGGGSGGSGYAQSIFATSIGGLHQRQLLPNETFSVSWIALYALERERASYERLVRSL